MASMSHRNNSSWVDIRAVTEEETESTELHACQSIYGARGISRRERDSWRWLRRKAAAVVESRRFELGMAILILSNTVLVALETNYHVDNGKTPGVLDIASMTMLVIYIADIVVRAAVYGRHFLQNAWNIFDVLVVAIDTVSEALYMYDWELGASMSVLRILRLGRLLRSLELLRIFEELHAMLALVISAWRAMIWGVVLMVLCLTLFAIVAVQVLHPLNKEIAEQTHYYDDCDRCGRTFSSVEHSILTFFQQIVAGDSWGQVSVVLIEHHPWTAPILVLPVFMVNLFLTNLVVTVMIDRAQDCREQNVQAAVADKERHVQALQRKFNRLCMTLDADQSGQLTLEEMEKGISDVPEFSDILKLLDIRPEDLPLVFDVMDRDKSGQVSYDEFVWQMYMMKTSLNTHSIMLITKAYSNDLRKEIAAQVSELQDELRSQFRGDAGHLNEVNGDTEGCDNPVIQREALDLKVAMKAAVDATSVLQASVDEFLAGKADSLLAEGLADTPGSVEGARANPVHRSIDQVQEARDPVIDKPRGMSPASLAAVQRCGADVGLSPRGDRARRETHTAGQRITSHFGRLQCIV